MHLVAHVVYLIYVGHSSSFILMLRYDKCVRHVNSHIPTKTPKVRLT